MAKNEETALAEKPKADVEVLSPSEKAAGEAKWEELIATFRKEMKSLVERTLKTYWEQGRCLLDLRQNPKVYAFHTIDELATKLSLGTSTLYGYARFHEKYPKLSDVDELVEKNLTWRDVNNVLTLEDDKTRNELLGKVAKEEINSNELMEAVKKAKKEEKERAKEEGQKERKAKKSASAVAKNEVKKTIDGVKSTNTMMKDLVAALDDFKEAYDSFQKMEDGRFKSDLQALLLDGFKGIGNLQKKLQFLVEYREKITAKKRAAMEAAKKI